jgi:hypothetical protein
MMQHLMFLLFLLFAGYFIASSCNNSRSQFPVLLKGGLKLQVRHLVFGFTANSTNNLQEDIHLCEKVTLPLKDHEFVGE